MLESLPKEILIVLCTQLELSDLQQLSRTSVGLATFVSENKDPIAKGLAWRRGFLDDQRGSATVVRREPASRESDLTVEALGEVIRRQGSMTSLYDAVLERNDWRGFLKIKSAVERNWAEGAFWADFIPAQSLWRIKVDAPGRQLVASTGRRAGYIYGLSHEAMVADPDQKWPSAVTWSIAKRASAHYTHVELSAEGHLIATPPNRTSTNELAVLQRVGVDHDEEDDGDVPGLDDLDADADGARHFLRRHILNTKEPLRAYKARGRFLAVACVRGQNPLCVEYFDLSSAELLRTIDITVIASGVDADEFSRGVTYVDFDDTYLFVGAEVPASLFVFRLDTGELVDTAASGVFQTQQDGSGWGDVVMACHHCGNGKHLLVCRSGGTLVWVRDYQWLLADNRSPECWRERTLVLKIDEGGSMHYFSQLSVENGRAVFTSRSEITAAGTSESLWLLDLEDPAVEARGVPVSTNPRCMLPYVPTDHGCSRLECTSDAIYLACLDTFDMSSGLPQLPHPGRLHADVDLAVRWYRPLESTPVVARKHVSRSNAQFPTHWGSTSELPLQRLPLLADCVLILSFEDNSRLSRRAFRPSAA